MARPRKENDDEKRTERLSLALTPIMHADITTLARMQGVSVNDFVAHVLELVAKKNQAVIEEFEAARQRTADKINFNVDDESEENL